MTDQPRITTHQPNVTGYRSKEVAMNGKGSRYRTYYSDEGRATHDRIFGKKIGKSFRKTTARARKVNMKCEEDDKDIVIVHPEFRRAFLDSEARRIDREMMERIRPIITKSLDKADTTPDRLTAGAVKNSDAT